MKNVYMVSDLREVYAIVKRYEKWDVPTFFHYAGIKIRVTAENILLGILQKLWFKKFTKTKIEHIVVYSVGILGDNIVRIPAILTLKKRFPNAKITVINKYQIWSPSPAEALFGNVPAVDNLFSIQSNPVVRKGFHFVYDPSELEGVKCDLFVSLSPLGNRGWFGAVLREMILAKNLKAHTAVGFRMYTVLNDKKLNRVKHRFIRNTPRLPETVLEQIGLAVDYSLDCFPKDEKKTKKVERMLEQSTVDGRFAVLHPGSKLECKNWPPEKFAEVATHLYRSYGMKSIITGVRSEFDIAEQIKTTAAEGCIINFAGRTSLDETAELIRKATIVISNDTGIMHLSSVMNRPTIGIFGTRLSPTIWWPLGEMFLGVFAFTKSSLRYSDDPNNSDLNAIEVDDVLSAVKQVLS